MPENFNLYIPSGKRKAWDTFRQRVDLEGKRTCDVVMDLVDGYMAGSLKTSRDSGRGSQ